MIVVLPFNDADKGRAERLLDCIYWLNGRRPDGHCLLVSGVDVHVEYRAKMRLAAEVAFESVELMEITSMANGTKPQLINRVFQQAGRYIHDSYKDPWLWLESDCVPLKQGWLSALFYAYEIQPKHYFGPVIDKKLSRVAIYPAKAIADYDKILDGDTIFDEAMPMAAKARNTPLIHVHPWAEGSVIPEASVLLKSDRSGTLIERIIETASTVVPEPTSQSRRKTRVAV